MKKRSFFDKLRHGVGFSVPDFFINMQGGVSGRKVWPFGVASALKERRKNTQNRLQQPVGKIAPAVGNQYASAHGKDVFTVAF